MANVGRISGSMLRKNLLRYAEDLAFEDNLLYLSVPDTTNPNKKVGIGIKRDIPRYELDVTGTTYSDIYQGEYLKIDNIVIDQNEIRASNGGININTNTNIDYLNISSRTFNLAQIPFTNTSRLDLTGNLEVNGNIHATGSITADGNLVLGNENTDTIQFNADIISDIIPDVDDTYDLGSQTKSWRQIFTDDLRLGGPQGTDAFNFTQGPKVNNNYTFKGLVDSTNYTKISNTNTDGHLALNANGNGLIELVSNSRVHENLRVEKDISTDNANFILMGQPELGILEGAVDMTEDTSLTDGVAQLNLILTLLVPPSPPPFPNNQNLIINNLTQRIINQDALSQPLNGTTVTAPAPGTVVYVARTNIYATSTITNTGPGTEGKIIVKRNSLPVIQKTLTFGNSTQVITTRITATTLGSDIVRFVQPTAGVLVPGYLIKTASSGAFGGLANDTFYIIKGVTAKTIKLSLFDATTGTQGLAFAATSTATGTINFTTQTDVGNFAGTYDLLVLSNNVASPLDTPGFYETIDIRVVGDTVPPGWNTVQIEHTGASDSTTIGSNTSNIGVWYFDDSDGLPVFTNQTFTLNTSNITYSSTVPHYNSSTVYDIGFTLTWNRGKTAHGSTGTNILTTGAVGPWTSAGNKNYANLGYTFLPQTTQVTNGSGPNTQTFRVNVVTGFGLWNTTTTVPIYTADNSYQTAQTALPALNARILYKTGTTSSTSFLDETNIFFNAAVGGSTTGATRCVNPDAGTASQDTPVFTAGSTLFNSQTGTLYDTDAIVVGTSTGVNSLTHNVTNYSTGYLPAGPNFSTRTAANPQYFTFRFTRSAVSKFRIRWTTPGGIAGIWAALPGANGTSLKSGHVNSWLSAEIDNSLAGGCALGGNLPKNGGTKQVNISFGTLSSTNSTNNEIWVRIRLNPGESLTSLYLDVSDQ